MDLNRRPTKTDASGVPLWRCDRCQEWLPRKDFAHRDARRGYICRVCHGVETDSVSAVLTLAFLTEAKPPISENTILRSFMAELNRVRAKRRERRLTKNDTKSITRVLFNQRTEFSPDWRPAVWSLLAEPGSLRARAVLWLGFRYGALTEAQCRRAALAWAKLAAEYVKLADEVDVEPAYVALEQVAETGKVTKFATQATYELMTKLRSPPEYVARARQLAGLALSAVLLPEGRDAMLGAGSWAYNALQLVKDMTVSETFMEFAALLGQAVEPELEKLDPKEKLEHWTGLERL